MRNHVQPILAEFYRLRNWRSPLTINLQGNQGPQSSRHQELNPPHNHLSELEIMPSLNPALKWILKTLIAISWKNLHGSEAPRPAMSRFQANRKCEIISNTWHSFGLGKFITQQPRSNAPSLEIFLSPSRQKNLLEIVASLPPANNPEYAWGHLPNQFLYLILRLT